MHAQHRPALWTGPLFIFIFDEMTDPEFLDAQKIIDRARSVIGFIAFVQMDQACARELGAVEAILKSSIYQFLAILNFTGDAAH
jgi:radical SAM superfamily enzyme with C-terminal helix-hairpin-helix motif